MMNKTALILEGGGLRGVYTAGILDYFLEKDIRFPYVIGVSMGACNAMSYISEQMGRNKKVSIDFVNDKRYLSYKNLFMKGSLFGMDFIFDEIPNKLVPFDYDTFNKSEQELVIACTDCETGKPYYLYKKECSNFVNNVLKASSSLPFISKIVELNGKKLLDGGLADSIPVKKAIDDGNEKLVLVMTRHKGYYKKPFKFTKFSSLIYRKYPFLVEAINNRYKMYNETLEYINELEKNNKAFVIRPEAPLEAGRIEKDKRKLFLVYEKGIQDAQLYEESLKKYLKS